MNGALGTERDSDPPRSSEESDAGSPTPTPNRWVRPRAPLLIVCFLYLALSAHLLYGELAGTGQLTYPLDDTYITMAMAKNLALGGIWGLTPDRFSPSSSCPGFLLLLAGAYRLKGPTVWWPLALSLTFGMLALIAAWRLLRGIHPAIQAIAVLAITILTPLHVLGVLGMEHTLHVMLILVFLDLTSRALAKGQPLSWSALLLAAAMVSVRYESLFAIAVAGLLFLVQRQVRAALSLGGAAATPVAIYGIAAVLHGDYWLPNSIALKGVSTNAVAQAPMELAHHFVSCLARAPYMGALLAVIIALLTVPSVHVNKRARVILIMVFGTTLIHLTLADVGWVYRYEAYLIAATIAAIACALPCVKISRDRWAAAAILVFGTVGLCMLLGRTVKAEWSLPQRSIANYSQQVQIARFLSLFEEGATVAANDVGAINYYANIHCLDLVGLGDQDVFWLRHRGMYSTQNLTRLAAARGVQIAVVYDSWFSISPVNQFSGPPLPLSWIRVARWHTPYGYYLGSDTVSFYAANPTNAEKLQYSLGLFAPSLPRDVRVYNEYVVSPSPIFARPENSQGAR